VPLAELYPDAIDNLLGVKSDRREFFERLISPNVPPSRGYAALTQILHQGWISTVLTPNFDPCLERAQVLHNRPHRLVRISTPADYVMFNSAPQDPQVIFLHGSVSHYTDKNLTAEVQSLDPILVEMLRPLLRDHPIIVVGYRGGEASVINDLFLSPAGHGFLHGVYWCVLGDDQAGALPPLVTQLAEAIGTNFQFVPIGGFDDLFEKDLLANMAAAGARPTRRPSGHSAVGMPADMRLLEGFQTSGFQRSLLQARLHQYAERTDMWRAKAIDDAWVEQMMDRLDLMRPNGDHKVATLAGWLLFPAIPRGVSSSPSPVSGHGASSLVEDPFWRRYRTGTGGAGGRLYRQAHDHGQSMEPA
jgi:hypothetical protein